MFNKTSCAITQELNAETVLPVLLDFQNGMRNLDTVLFNGKANLKEDMVKAEADLDGLIKRLVTSVDEKLFEALCHCPGTPVFDERILEKREELSSLEAQRAFCQGHASSTEGQRLPDEDMKLLASIFDFNRANPDAPITSEQLEQRWFGKGNPFRKVLMFFDNLSSQPDDVLRGIPEDQRRRVVGSLRTWEGQRKEEEAQQSLEAIEKRIEALREELSPENLLLLYQESIPRLLEDPALSRKLMETWENGQRQDAMTFATRKAAFRSLFLFLSERETRGEGITNGIMPILKDMNAVKGGKACLLEIALDFEEVRLAAQALKCELPYVERNVGAMRDAVKIFRVKETDQPLEAMKQLGASLCVCANGSHLDPAFARAVLAGQRIAEPDYAPELPLIEETDRNAVRAVLTARTLPTIGKFLSEKAHLKWG